MQGRPGVECAYKEIHPGNGFFCHEEYIALLFGTLAKARKYAASLQEEYPADTPWVAPLPRGKGVVIIQTCDSDEGRDEHNKTIESWLERNEVAIHSLPTGSSVLAELHACSVSTKIAQTFLGKSLLSFLDNTINDLNDSKKIHR